MKLFTRKTAAQKLFDTIKNEETLKEAYFKLANDEKNIGAMARYTESFGEAKLINHVFILSDNNDKNTSVINFLLTKNDGVLIGARLGRDYKLYGFDAAQMEVAKAAAATGGTTQTTPRSSK